MRDYIISNPIFCLTIGVCWLFAIKVILSFLMVPKFKDCSIVKRMIWSIIVIFPIFGMVFYIAFFRVPSSNQGGNHAPMNSDAFWGGGSF